ncbi:MAG: DUF4249 domain-containing protein [Prevotellaceae bacterium]|jgi:hypothetical protein|nr:DUF4249 domain-containing protein [Prevotellaceae bacterium]
MKTGIFIFVVNVFVCAVLAGCEKNVDFRGKELPPKMVINSIIGTASDTCWIKVSESVFDFSDQSPDTVKNPKIQLSINSKKCDGIWLDTIIGVHSYYKFVAGKLNVGDRIDISAATQKHGTVSGYDIVPDTVEIKNIETEWFMKKDDRSYLRMHVTFKDKPGERNFYRIIVKTYSILINPADQKPTNQWYSEKVYIDDEMLFHNPAETDEEGKMYNHYRMFSDDLIDGKEYTLNIHIENYNEANNPDLDYVEEYVKVELHTLSEKLYRNLHSQELAYGTIGDVFVEPVKIYTNIKGGYGIFGAYNVSEKIKCLGKKGV